MDLVHEQLTPAALALIQPGATYISGRWHDGEGDLVDVIDPSLGEVCGKVSVSSLSDVDNAVKAARSAFAYDSPWRRFSHMERSRCLSRLADLIESKAEAFAQLGTLEVGSPITLSRQLHAAGPVSFFRFWAEAAVRGPHGGYEEALPLLMEPRVVHSQIFREPIGVVAAVSAYNFPLLITSFKVGGALAAGCTTVLMTSPRTLLSAMAFMSCVEEAGIPPGVVNLVSGPAEIGQRLTQSPGVDLVSFTGSVAVGKSVMRQVSDDLKHVVLELGGKSPNILLPSASVAEAVESSVLRFVRNAGQGCGATTRTFVPRNRYEEYAASARSVIEFLRVGSAWDETTDVGPVIRADHRDRILGYVTRATESGAVILAGGGVIDAPGFYVSPTLVGGVDNSAEICQEELFGPVGVLIPYDSVDDAIDMANDTVFGLNSNVWGRADEAMAVARRLKAGTVTINGGGPDRPDAPWPGAGHSGVGIDRGMDGFREFFHVRHVQYPLGSL